MLYCSKRNSPVSNMPETRQIIVWILVLLYSKTTYVLSNQSFQMKAEHLNRQLVGYKLFDITDVTHHKCVTECMFIGACVSVNFITCSRTCELNSVGSVEVDNPSDFVEAPGTIFSDISEWPQVKLYSYISVYFLHFRTSSLLITLQNLE